MPRRQTLGARLARGATAVAALAWLCAGSPARAGDAPDVAALVTTAAVRQGSIPDIVSAYGTASAAQEGGAAVSLPQDGRVSAVLVTPGERVRAGQALLSFELSANGASLYAQAVTAYQLAGSERAHTGQMLAQHLATRDQLAQADKAVADAKTTLAALMRQGADRSHTTITAAFDAIVQAIPVAQGDRVAGGAPLMKLIPVDGTGVNSVVVTVGVDPADVGRLRPGQSAQVHEFGAAPAIEGSVARLDAVVNPRSHLVDIDIGVPPGSVVIGQAFRADITAGRLAGWLVPHQAVLMDENGAFLFQAAGGRAHRVPVKVLGTQGDTDAVSGALAAPDPVITEGGTQVADGDAVRFAP